MTLCTDVKIIRITNYFFCFAEYMLLHSYIITKKNLTMKNNFLRTIFSTDRTQFSYNWGRLKGNLMLLGMGTIQNFKVSPASNGNYSFTCCLRCIQYLGLHMIVAIFFIECSHFYNQWDYCIFLLSNWSNKNLHIWHD